jgi:PEP-CTERM/exosortase A-associated glycosyltransferase
VDGLEFHRTQPLMGSFYSLPVVNQWAVVTSLRRRLRQVVPSVGADLIHVHSPCLNGLAALPIARRLALPIIYEVRSLWEDAAVDSGLCRGGDLRYRVSRALETYVCCHVDHVVTICEGLRGEVLRRGVTPDRVTVVPNSVDFERFGQARTRDEAAAARLGLAAGKTFGFIGTFFPFEGLDVMLRAAAIIGAAEPQARFLLVGDGPEEPRLRAMARELGVKDSVIFTGRVPHSEVDDYYDLIDVMIYPRVSKRITELVTPLKPLEAMAKEKLVVASNVGGHLEMVFPEDTGVLFRAGDPESLADVCLELLTRSRAWAGLRERGKAYVSAARSWRRTVEIYDVIYQRLLLGSRAR